jgi:uncharacterized damage-inducible protein DinB
LNADYFRTLYDYHYWARDKVLAAAEGMTEDEYAKDTGFTYKSVRGMLMHTMTAEIMWLARARGESISFADLPNGESHPTLDALSEHWAKVESLQRSYLQSLQDDDLEKDVVFTGRDGNEFRQPLWQILTLVYSHAIQHRSEAAEALTMAARSPGNLDFMVYVRERGQ